jgi:hypothetical protein
MKEDTMDTIDPTQIPLDELERKRDALALDSRSDPELRWDLEEVEAELGRRARETARTLAASREGTRRSEEGAAAERDAAVKRQEQHLAGLGRERRNNALVLEEALSTLVACLTTELRLSNEMADAASALGKPSSVYAGAGLVEKRIACGLWSAAPKRMLDFSRPIDAYRYNSTPLAELLTSIC